MKKRSKPRSSLDSQVGDVGREVGRLARAAHEHAVLVVAAELLRAQPERVVGAVGGRPPAGSPAPRWTGLGSPSCSDALAEPGVELDAVVGERGADPRDHQLTTPSAARRVGVQLGRARDLPGQLSDVLALVAVLGRLLAARASHDRRAEAGDLPAGVVEVVLALDRVALEAEQATQRVAVGGVAAGGGGQRAGRVGGDELDLDLLRRVGRAAAEAVARRQHVRRGAGVPVVGQEDVQEAGAGDLDVVDLRAQAWPAARRRASRRSRAAAPSGRARAASRRWSRSRRSRPSSGARASGALLGAGPPLRSSAAAASTAERRSSIGVTSVMVGLAGEDLVGAEELLEQHDPRELVRERHRAEREPVVAAVELCAVRAADHEADVEARPGGDPPASARTPRSRRRCHGRRAATRTHARGGGGRRRRRRPPRPRRRARA